MLPVISIVGSSDSGKTSFLEKLIPELVQRGYRVGAIKHDAHGFEMDREGKDTWRMNRAGAGTVSLCSASQVAVLRRTEAEIPLEEIAMRFFWKEDILLTEGFKKSHFPKIEVFRSAVEPEPICGDKDNLIAFVTDDPLATALPRFATSDAPGVADFLENRYLRDRKKPAVLVQIDGKRLPMKDFVGDFLAGGIMGMLSSLRGWKKPRSLSIHIRLEDD